MSQLYLEVVPENPLLVRRHLDKDMYVVKDVTMNRMVREINAANETVDYTMTWKEPRLRKRSKIIKRNGKYYSVPRKTTKAKTIRAELADALKTPFRFIQDEEHHRLVKDHFRQLKGVEVSQSDTKPMIIAFLNLYNDDVGGHRTEPRGSYKILEYYDHEMMVIQDSEGESYTLKFTEEQMKLAVKTCQIIFMPSNVYLKSD